MNSKAVFVSATAVATVVINISSSATANAEGLLINTHNSIHTIIEAISPASTSNRILHYFDPPLTFSYMDSSENAEVITKAKIGRAHV